MTRAEHENLIRLVDETPGAEELKEDVRRPITYTRTVDAQSYRSGAWEVVAKLVKQDQLPEALDHYYGLLDEFGLSCFQAGWAIKVARGLKGLGFSVKDTRCDCAECKVRV